MSIVVSPTLLFIEEDNWKIGSKQEIFLNNLNKVFDYSMSSDIKILWNDVLEELLWCHSDLHPWLDVSNYRIIELLHKCIINIRESKEYTACFIDPKIDGFSSKYDLISPTLSILHYTLANNINFSFIVDSNNNNKFSLSCNCHKKSIKINAKSVENLQVAFCLNDYLKDNWQELCNDSDLLRNLIFKMQLILFPNAKIDYDISFEPSFLHSLENVISDGKRELIINKIVYRLTLSKYDVSKVAGFKDEPVRGTKITRRFRINDASRIHYHYETKNKFIFSDFYTESEHDKGL